MLEQPMTIRQWRRDNSRSLFRREVCPVGQNMRSANTPRSLSDYRLEKARRRLQRRLDEAEKAFESTKDYDAMQRLKLDAVRKYLREIPELRELRRRAKPKPNDAL